MKSAPLRELGTLVRELADPPSRRQFPVAITAAEPIVGWLACVRSGDSRIEGMVVTAVTAGLMT